MSFVIIDGLSLIKIGQLCPKNVDGIDRKLCHLQWNKIYGIF